MITTYASEMTRTQVESVLRGARLELAIAEHAITGLQLKLIMSRDPAARVETGAAIIRWSKVVRARKSDLVTIQAMLREFSAVVA